MLRSIDRIAVVFPMPAEQANVEIRLLNAEEMHRILPLIQQLNPTIPSATLTKRLAEMIELGYQCVGAFKNGKLVGAAGMWFGARFYCGRYIDVDNVIVDQEQRSSGIGSLLMSWIEAYARTQRCEVSVLDAYTTNTSAHRFYLRDGYKIIGFHFYKDL